MAWLIGLCLLPTLALGESPSLIATEMMQTDAVTYKTAVVAADVYERSYSASPSEFYPYQYNLRFETSGAKFGKYLVERDQEVKAGDVLAVFSLETDEVALATRRQTLERLQRSYEKELVVRQENLQALIESLDAQADLTQRQLLALRIQRAEVELEQYVYQQEKAISDAQAEIAEMEETMSQNVLIAPCDGVVASLAYMREGDLVSTSEVLVTLYRTDRMLLRIDNTSGNFRYGMEITVETGPVKNRVQIPGRVVGADTLLPQSRRNGYAYIEVDMAALENVRRTRMSVSAKTFYLENVIVVPRTAVELEGGKYRVQLLVDGKVQIRYINTPLMNSSQVWALQGLMEGDEIIID